MADARLDDDGAHPAPGLPDPLAAPRAPRQRDSGVAHVVQVLGLLGGVLLIGVLFSQYLDVYLAFFGEQNVATPRDGTRYLVTVTACVALLVAGTAAAAVRGRGGVAAVGGLLLIAGLLAAVLFAVPSDRFTVAPPDNRPGPDYVPCYSGSGDCPGG